MTHYSAIITPPFPVSDCCLGVVMERGRVTGLDYLFGEIGLVRGNGEGVRAVIEQLACYFRDGGYRFRLPLALRGTPFQKRVWSALMTIPAGTSVTYGVLAATLNSSARAVGNACRANPVPIIVPCHRVVGAGGLGGYAGNTRGRHIIIKHWLLSHEAAEPIVGRGRSSRD